MSDEKEFENIHEETDKLVTRASVEDCIFKLEDMDQFMIGPHYSSSIGTAVRGKKLQVVLVNKPKGTGSRLHTHANEQFNLVLKGKVKYRVGKKEGIAGPGQLIHIPANEEHYVVTMDEEDAVYFAAKDVGYYVSGDAVDGKKSGAFIASEDK